MVYSAACSHSCRCAHTCRYLSTCLKYLKRIYFLSIPMMIIHNLCTAIFQALGDSKRPVVLLAVGGVLNVCFDAILIIVLPWGVVGAGIATLFSQSIAAIALFIILIQVDEAVISIGCHIMRIIFPWYIIYSLMEVTASFIRGYGRTFSSMLISMIFLCGSRVIFLKLFSSVLTGITGVACVYPLTWLPTMFVYIIYVLFLRIKLYTK